MEGIAATQNTILVDTTNVRVDIDTNSYSGSVSSVGLYTSSNVVVSTESKRNGTGCIIYATGTASCVKFMGDGSGLTGISAGSSALVFVSSEALNASASVTLGGFASSTTYICTFQITFTGANSTSLLLRFNGDTGANYKNGNYGVNDSGAAAGSGASSAAIQLLNSQGGTYNAGTTDYVHGTYVISTVAGRPTRVSVYGFGSAQYGSDAQWFQEFGGGRYVGASNLSTLTILPSGAGGMTGFAECFQMKRT